MIGGNVRVLVCSPNAATAAGIAAVLSRGGLGNGVITKVVGRTVQMQTAARAITELRPHVVVCGIRGGEALQWAPGSAGTSGDVVVVSAWRTCH